MDKAQLRDLLEAKYREYNRPDFVSADPICVPHGFSQKEDIEISGFFSAIMAWGRRDIIIRNARRLMALMGECPYDFVREASAEEIQSLDGFVHRTLQGPDIRGLVYGLRRAYAEAGGLEGLLAARPEETDTGPAIGRARAFLLETPGMEDRTKKHLANPASGSSAKRLNMYLRWMVRRDRRGVDFGLWQSLRTDQLVMPLDVHTGNVGRKLGLLHRKQNDWKAALELTKALCAFDAADPVKYDFSLFGMGIYEQF